MADPAEWLQTNRERFHSRTSALARTSRRKSSQVVPFSPNATLRRPHRRSPPSSESASNRRSFSPLPSSSSRNWRADWASGAPAPRTHLPAPCAPHGGARRERTSQARQTRERSERNSIMARQVKLELNKETPQRALRTSTARTAHRYDERHELVPSLPRTFECVRQRRRRCSVEQMGVPALLRPISLRPSFSSRASSASPRGPGGRTPDAQS